ncbi:MAG: hypothetical protein HZA66_09205 [Rhodopseudomonas palustris]|uniref:Uncharacterized protein n=1 Tax=Rhodopseudomonas palustris TaxID=1076 RepID=A0A933W0M0_RHOPL|nr:hypothetical protein [Rhodopseudomonas palustris]
MTAFQWFALTSPIVLAAIMAIVGLVETWLDRRGSQRDETLAAKVAGERSYLDGKRRYLPPGE